MHIAKTEWKGHTRGEDQRIVCSATPSDCNRSANPTRLEDIGGCIVLRSRPSRSSVLSKLDSLKRFRRHSSVTRVGKSQAVADSPGHCFTLHGQAAVCLSPRAPARRLETSFRNFASVMPNKLARSMIRLQCPQDTAVRDEHIQPSFARLTASRGVSKSGKEWYVKVRSRLSRGSGENGA